MNDRETNSDLRVALLPLDISYADPDANLDRVEALVENAGVADLYVLPELFSTGFITKPHRLEQLAQTDQDATVEALRRMARSRNAAFAGSFLATDNQGRYFNRAFFIGPEGDEAFYDKHHLFTHSGEHRILTPGAAQSPTVSYRGWRVRVLVCYDLRFPCWCRNRQLDYDLLLFPSNWPEQRAYAFRQLLVARAIENQAYVAGADRSGSDPMGVYPPEMTQIFDFMGRPLGPTAVLSRKALDEARRSFPVYLDAD